MQYPLNRPSKPLSPEMAKAISDAIEQGKSLTTPEALAVFERIAQRIAERQARQTHATEKSSTTEIR